MDVIVCVYIIYGYKCMVNPLYCLLETSLYNDTFSLSISKAKSNRVLCAGSGAIQLTNQRIDLT